MPVLPLFNVRRLKDFLIKGASNLEFLSHQVIKPNPFLRLNHYCCVLRSEIHLLIHQRFADVLSGIIFYFFLHFQVYDTFHTACLISQTCTESGKLYNLFF